MQSLAVFCSLAAQGFFTESTTSSAFVVQVRSSVIQLRAERIGSCSCSYTREGASNLRAKAEALVRIHNCHLSFFGL